MKSDPKRVLIIDDEPAARIQLREVIDTLPDLEIIGELGDGNTAIEAIISQSPDIVFLDIDMPGVDGFNVAKATENIGYQLVFVTAHHQHALRAFDTHAIDYLLKPARPSVIEKCLAKILRQEVLTLAKIPARENTANLVLSDSAGTRIINNNHVLYIEALGRYRRIHLSEQGSQIHGLATLLSDTTLETFADQLGKSDFIRIHRSYLVNLAFATTLKPNDRRYDLVLEGVNENIPVARSRVKHLRSALAKHYK